MDDHGDTPKVEGLKMLETSVNRLREFIAFDSLLAGALCRNADGSVTIGQVLGSHGIASS